MRRILDSFSLFINRNIYYNFICGKSLKQLNNLFKGLIFTLKKISFKFNYLIINKLAENNNYKKKILE